MYDPVADTWELGATTTGREAFATTVLPDGQVLVAGGKARQPSSSTMSPLATAETWDPVSGTFSPAGDMGAGRSGGCRDAPAGRPRADRRRASTTATRRTAPDCRTSIRHRELWDPESRTFSPAGTMAAQRSGHTATLLDDGHVLLVGGVKRLPDRDVPVPPFAEVYVGQ